MSESNLSLINNIESVNDFNYLLLNNQGLIIIKLTAKWCNPCKIIEPNVKTLFENMPNNVQCITIDIDNSIDLYSFFKKKRVINGVPAILCYFKGNISFIPDDFVIGASIDKISDLNDRCIKNAISISNNSIKIDYSKLKPIKPLPIPDPIESQSEQLQEEENTIDITTTIPIEEVIMNNISKKERYILKNRTRKNNNKIYLL
jgi:thioredoxin 1